MSYQSVQTKKATRNLSLQVFNDFFAILAFVDSGAHRQRVWMQMVGQLPYCHAQSA
ncbi:MAG: hypothetical protein Q7T78_05245 [Rhodoferax sp.]|nr:hypothetical protein [Rhodoferax sp.]